MKTCRIFRITIIGEYSFLVKSTISEDELYSTKYYLIKMSTADTEVRLNFDMCYTNVGLVEIYQNPTVTSNGTLLSGTTSPVALSIYSEPIITNEGTFFYNADASSLFVELHVLTLNANTDYLLKITPEDLNYKVLESVYPRDIGMNWKDLGAITTHPIRASCYIGSGITIVGTETGHIFRSTDYGTTWIDLGNISTSDVLTLSYLGRGIVIFGDFSGHIFRSTDYGATWTDLGAISTSYVRVLTYLGNGISLFSDGVGHIFRSTNYGATWPTNLTISTVAIRCLLYLVNGIAICGDDNGHMFRSTDYGATWTDLGVISSTFTFDSVYLDNGIAIFTNNSGQIFRSTNYGVTWTNLGTISTALIRSSLYLGNEVSICCDGAGHIFRSADSGMIWTDLGAISTGTIFTSCYLSNGIAIFGDGTGHIFQSDIACKLDECSLLGRIIPTSEYFNVNEQIWTDQPSALTEFAGITSRRMKINLSNMTKVRIIANVKTAGASGAKLAGQYSTNQTTWNYLDDSSEPSVTIDTTGLKVSSYVSISTSAKSDIFLRIAGLNGNGATDPAFGIIALQFL